MRGFVNVKVNAYVNDTWWKNEDKGRPLALALAAPKARGLGLR